MINKYLAMGLGALIAVAPLSLRSMAQAATAKTSTHKTHKTQDATRPRRATK